MHIMTDLKGNRVVICDSCRKIKSTNDFVIYGGKGTENIGICRNCAKKKGWIKCDTDQKLTRGQTTEYLNILL